MIKIIVLAPIEILLQIVLGAFKGFIMALENIRDAWLNKPWNGHMMEDRSKKPT